MIFAVTGHRGKKISSTHPMRPSIERKNSLWVQSVVLALVLFVSPLGMLLYLLLRLPKRRARKRESRMGEGRGGMRDPAAATV